MAINKTTIVFLTIFLTLFNASANQNIPTIKDYLNDENKNMTLIFMVWRAV